MLDSIKKSVHITKSKKSIEVYDGMYDYNKQVQLMKWILKQPFFFNIANDAVLLDQSSKLNCSSQINWSKEDYIERFEIQKNNSIFEKIKNKNFSRCWINATTGQHVPRYHPDAFKPDSLTILYYVNLKWDIDWDGQTIWRTDDMQNIEYISDFIPGRICIFDSSIPHKGCVPNNDAPTFRFTLNSVWE